jgi:hypothetical protein
VVCARSSTLVRSVPPANEHLLDGCATVCHAKAWGIWWVAGRAGDPTTPMHTPLVQCMHAWCTRPHNRLTHLCARRVDTLEVEWRASLHDHRRRNVRRERDGGSGGSGQGASAPQQHRRHRCQHRVQNECDKVDTFSESTFQLYIAQQMHELCRRVLLLISCSSKLVLAVTL